MEGKAYYLIGREVDDKIHLLNINTAFTQAEARTALGQGKIVVYKALVEVVMENGEIKHKKLKEE